MKFFPNGRHYGRWLLLALPFLPFLGLHLMVMIFAPKEKPLTVADVVFYPQPDGSPLATFWHQQPGAYGTIVFVHGTPATAAAFREQMRADFPGYNLVAYDRPGFGQSPGSRAQANLPYQAETLTQFIRLLATPKIVLVGHSYGGPIILKTATQIPERVTGVVLIGGSVSPQEEHPWLVQYLGDWPVIRWFVPQPFRSCNRELLLLKNDLIQLQGEIAQIRCPVLMLHGTADTLVPLENVAYLRARFAALGQSRLFFSQLFSGYTHFMLWEHADEMNASIRQFLKK